MPSGCVGSFYMSKSSFAKRLKPVGRALELEDYYVWCNSPIEADDGEFMCFLAGGMQRRGWVNG